MFKRISKRLKRKEEEEALGLDEDMKEVLGMHDTDSSESDTDSEVSESDNASITGGGASSGIGGEEEEEEESAGSDTKLLVSRKRKLALEDDEAEDRSLEDDGHSANGESDVDVGEPPLTITQTLKDPIYILHVDPPLQACIICSGKKLKNATMLDVHKNSAAHRRRFEKFIVLANTTTHVQNVFDILELMKGGQALTPSKQNEDITPMSKRAAKRIAKIEVLAKKREKQKQMKAKARAKKEAKAAITAPTTTPAAGPHTSTSTLPPAKKRKVAKEEGPVAFSGAPTDVVGPKKQPANIPTASLLPTSVKTPSSIPAKMRKLQSENDVSRVKPANPGSGQQSARRAKNMSKSIRRESANGTVKTKEPKQRKLVTPGISRSSSTSSAYAQDMNVKLKAKLSTKARKARTAP